MMTYWNIAMESRDVMQHVSCAGYESSHTFSVLPISFYFVYDTDVCERDI